MAFSVLDAQGRLKQFSVPSVFSLTTTGNIDNLDFQNADMIRFNNATLSTLRGLKAGYSGQRVTIVSIGAGHVFLAHQNANSDATNRLLNWVTSGSTPLATATGVATYQYDGVTLRWRIVDHCQGAGITPAFAAGDYTASGSMTWTVGSGDVSTNTYLVHGKYLLRSFFIGSTTVGGTPSNELRSANPNGYTAANRVFNAGVMNDNGTAANGYLDTKAAANTYVGFFLSSGANWAAATDNTSTLSAIDFEIQ
jgi:hypothetical protein